MLVSWLDKTFITTNDMTAEGLENLKAVARKAIELQVNAVLVMGTLQSIYCDEADELEQESEEKILSAINSTRTTLNLTISTVLDIQKAYSIEKALAELVGELDKRRDDEKG